jgi:hypothetical protein
LPTLIVIALAPREGSEGLWIAALGVVGIFGLLRLRTFGVLAMFSSGLLLSVAMLLHTHFGAASPSFLSPFVSYGLIHAMGFTAALLLVAASAPFLRPVARFLTSRAN